MKLSILSCAILIVSVCACVAQPAKPGANQPGTSGPQNVESVAHTLETYQAGKTSLEDFVRDGQLINASHPPPFDAGPHPSPNFLLNSIFRAPADSPWKIYETGYEFRDFTRTRKYVVGDTNKAICILTFGENGGLASIVPAPAISPAPGVPAKPAPPLPPQSVEVVARTLHTYKPGKTTLNDFMRDARLVRGTPFRGEYLSGPPPFLNDTLSPSRAGPWKIYHEDFKSVTGKDGGPVVTEPKYLVGDTNKPYCTLGFDGQGKLTSISWEP